VRVKSQSYKKKGKNTIGFLGKGKNTNFPFSFIFCLFSIFLILLFSEN